MFKLFNRSKGHRSTFKGPSTQMMGDYKPGVMQQYRDDKGLTVDQAMNDLNIIHSKIVSLKQERDKLKLANIELSEQIEALRKQKVYAGQKFYNPKNHKAATLYLCARWNNWYTIRFQNEAEPRLVTAEWFNDNYGYYVLMPKQNFNRKRLG